MQHALDCAARESLRVFTGTLRAFERELGALRSLSLPDARTLYSHCAGIFRTADAADPQYNALRIVKFVTYTRAFMRAHHADLWQLYRATVLHPNGNVRYAGMQLCAHWANAMQWLWDPWGRSGKRHANGAEFGACLTAAHLELDALEQQYIEEHDEVLETEGVWDCFGRPMRSTETADKVLKSIRAGMEALWCGSMDDLMATHGYGVRSSLEYPELLSVGRYERVAQHPTPPIPTCAHGATFDSVWESNGQ